MSFPIDQSANQVPSGNEVQTKCSVVIEPPFRIKSNGIFFKNVQEALKGESEHQMTYRFTQNKLYYKFSVEFGGQTYKKVFIPISHLVLEATHTEYPTGIPRDAFTLEMPEVSIPEEEQEEKDWISWYLLLNHVLSRDARKDVPENTTLYFNTSAPLDGYKVLPVKVWENAKKPFVWEEHVAAPGKMMLEVAYGVARSAMNKREDVFPIGVYMQVSNLKDRGVLTFSNAQRHANNIAKKRKILPETDISDYVKSTFSEKIPHDRDRWIQNYFALHPCDCDHCCSIADELNKRYISNYDEHPSWKEKKTVKNWQEEMQRMRDEVEDAEFEAEWAKRAKSEK